jgi:hypothetical protein
MAPVTSGVANRQEDHPILAPCPDENIINQLKSVLRIRDILVRIRIRGSVPTMDPDPDPAIFVTDLEDFNNKNFLSFSAYYRAF